MYILVLDNNTDIPISFSENGVLELQDYFLAPGIHYIKIKDLAAGRALMQVLLPIFYPSSYAAYIAMIPSFANLASLYNELKECAIDEEALENYLLTSFYYDFLFIEESKKLARESWYALFKRMLESSSLISSLPCMILSYEVE